MHVAPHRIPPRQNLLLISYKRKKTCRFGKSKLPGPRQHPNPELPEPVICCRIDVASKPLQFALPPLQRCIRGASSFPPKRLGNLSSPFPPFLFPLLHNHAGHSQNRRALCGAAQRCPPWLQLGQLALRQDHREPAHQRRDQGYLPGLHWKAGNVCLFDTGSQTGASEEGGESYNSSKWMLIV